jgi:hypothetical protein
MSLLVQSAPGLTTRVICCAGSIATAKRGGGSISLMFSICWIWSRCHHSFPTELSVRPLLAFISVTGLHWMFITLCWHGETASCPSLRFHPGRGGMAGLRSRPPSFIRMTRCFCLAQGPILAVSRRGHRPLPRQMAPPIGPWLDPAAPPSSRLALWRQIRRRVWQAARKAADWPIASMPTVTSHSPSP